MSQMIPMHSTLHENYMSNAPCSTLNIRELKCFGLGPSTRPRVLTARGLQRVGISERCSCRKAPLLPKPRRKGEKLFCFPLVKPDTNRALPTITTWFYFMLSPV